MGNINGVSLKFNNHKPIPIIIPSEPVKPVQPTQKGSSGIAKSIYNKEMSTYNRNIAFYNIAMAGYNKRADVQTADSIIQKLAAANISAGRMLFNDSLAGGLRTAAQVHITNNKDKSNTLSFGCADVTKPTVINQTILQLFERSFDELLEIYMPPTVGAKGFSGKDPVANVLQIDFQDGGASKLIFKNENINIARYRGRKIAAITILPASTTDVPSIVEAFTVDEIGFDSSDKTTRWVLLILVVLIVLYYLNKNKQLTF